MISRELSREEIEQIWTIDRSETIDNVYYLEEGTLVLKSEHYDMRGWPPGEADQYGPILYDCFDHGGWFLGVFDESRLVAVAVLESRFTGSPKDKLQFLFLHVSGNYRKRGLGKKLFFEAAKEARNRGARRLHLSATPSENTVNFYLRRGCRLTNDVDPQLLEIEPEDIHLEYAL